METNQEPGASSKEPPKPPEESTTPRNRSHLDREHPIGVEMADVVRGILQRAQLSWLLKHYASTPILALFSCINGCISIGMMAGLALLTGSPLYLSLPWPDSLPFLLYPNCALSLAPQYVDWAWHRRAGWVFQPGRDRTDNRRASAAVGVSGPRVVAAGLSLGLTTGLMVLLRAPHPPAGATTLIVSLGIITKPLQLVILMGAVVLLIVQALVINRLAGIPYPFWGPKRPQ